MTTNNQDYGNSPSVTKRGSKMVGFDENENITFILGNTIEGWRQGIRLIGEGGSIRLYIPSVLGYGSQGVNSIPKNQVLFFDVDLLKVN